MKFAKYMASKHYHDTSCHLYPVGCQGMDAWRMQQLHVVEYFYVRKCCSWPATCNPWYPDQAMDVRCQTLQNGYDLNVKGKSCGESWGRIRKMAE